MQRLFTLLILPTSSVDRIAEPSADCQRPKHSLTVYALALLSLEFPDAPYASFALNVSRAAGESRQCTLVTSPRWPYPLAGSLSEGNMIEEVVL